MTNKHIEQPSNTPSVSEHNFAQGQRMLKEVQANFPQFIVQLTGNDHYLKLVDKNSSAEDHSNAMRWLQFMYQKFLSEADQARKDDPNYAKVATKRWSRFFLGK